MLRFGRKLMVTMLLGTSAIGFAGCGTTRSSDTSRTATEQLLISDAIDRAVDSMNLKSLAGQSIYLDDSKLSDTVDKNYVISTLRQQLLANGCELRDKREEAEFVVEARAGAIGTDRNDLLFGIPSMNMPQIPIVQPVPAAIPEIPFAKRKDQRGIAKIAVFAYHRATGTPVWQSGIVRQESSANDVWILGAGPFQRGTIYEGTTFAGNAIRPEDPTKPQPVPKRTPNINVAQENLFTPPQKLAKKDPPATSPKTDPKVALATHTEPMTPSKPWPTPTAVATPPATPMPSPFSHQAESQPLTAPISQPSQAPKATATVSKNSPPSSQPEGTAYARTEADPALPQPRFNSPQ